MSDVLHIDPAMLAKAIQPLTPNLVLHMLDSMTWFPDKGDARWQKIARYVGDRDPAGLSHRPDVFRSTYEALAEAFGLERDGKATRHGRWAAIPSPKGVYQLKYAIKTMLLPNHWFNCMNMGFSDPARPAGWVDAPPGREIMKFSLQLYDHVASQVDLAGRDVLEVGSGRGGGAAFLEKRYKPRSYVGMDLSNTNVDFSRAANPRSPAVFMQGDAEAIPFDDGSLDVVINIESAHCYPDVGRFLREVHRVLRPDGCVLFSDEWWNAGYADLQLAVAASGFEIVLEENITENIILALTDLKRAFPGFLANQAEDDTREVWMDFFANRVCTDSAESYTSGRFRFFNMVLKKKEPTPAASVL